MLFIICGNGFAYAQTFNETPIPAFTLHKEMKTPQIFKLPEIKNTLSETNPAFNNSMPLVRTEKKILLSGSRLHRLF